MLVIFVLLLILGKIWVEKLKIEKIMANIFENIENLKADGFEGFHTIKELTNSKSKIPTNKGVYMVLRTINTEPKFLGIGTGGHFKNKNPNVTVDMLDENWVTDTVVVYIGKAGDIDKEGGRISQHFAHDYGYT